MAPFARSARLLDVVLLVTDDDGAANVRTHTGGPAKEATTGPGRPSACRASTCVPTSSACPVEDKSQDDDGARVGWR